jgi:hypothetical protein
MTERAELPQRLKELAVRRLPSGLGERMAEEWQAHLAATPGSVAQTVVAVGFLIAAARCKLAAKITRSSERPSIANRVLAAVILLIEAPNFLIAAVLIKLANPGPVFVWSSRLADGRLVNLPTFRCPPGLIGWLLRKTEFRQLPILYSVLRGDLTLVRRRRPGA